MMTKIDRNNSFPFSTTRTNSELAPKRRTHHRGHHRVNRPLYFCWCAREEERPEEARAISRRRSVQRVSSLRAEVSDAPPPRPGRSQRLFPYGRRDVVLMVARRGIRLLLTRSNMTVWTHNGRRQIVDNPPFETGATPHGLTIIVTSFE